MDLQLNCILLKFIRKQRVKRGMDKSTEILDIPWNVNDAEMSAQYELDQEVGIEKRE